MVSSIHPDYGILLAVGGNLGHRLRHSPQLKQDHGPSHDPWQHLGSGLHHDLLVSACSLLPLSLQFHLSPQYTHSFASNFSSVFPPHSPSSIFPISPSHIRAVVVQEAGAQVSPFQFGALDMYVNPVCVCVCVCVDKGNYCNYFEHM